MVQTTGLEGPPSVNGRASQPPDAGIDQQTLERLVVANLGLVRHLCRRFLHSREPMEDLMQTGYIGLLQAARLYDPARGASFACFATPWILGQVHNYFRDHSWQVRLPRKLGVHGALVERATMALAQQKGRWPNVAEIAMATSLEESEVEAAELATNSRTTFSLDAPTSDGQGNYDIEALGCSDDDPYNRVDDWLLIAQGLAVLDERSRTIVMLKFCVDLTQQEIARRMGMSAPHVCRLLQRALNRLRGELSATTTEDQGDTPPQHDRSTLPPNDFSNQF